MNGARFTKDVTLELSLPSIDNSDGTVAIRNVRFTSTPAVRGPRMRRWRSARILFTPQPMWRLSRDNARALAHATGASLASQATDRSQ